MCIYVRIYAFHAKEELDINVSLRYYQISLFSSLKLGANKEFLPPPPPPNNEYLGMGMVDGKLLLMIRT